MILSADLFANFFEEVYGHSPFPWQQELARRAVAGDWPKSIALPTAAGKTALIDISVFALACGAAGAARRTFFVVDRRVVVDEASERAKKLCKALSDSRQKDSAAGAVARALIELTGDSDADPLVLATLRGGMPREDSWTRSPLQPAICCSTVDQVGSSILFRAYGSRSNYNWPIRAALVAYDALIIIDEAHTANPFMETLSHIARYRKWAEDEWAQSNADTGRTFRVIEMSATPRKAENTFRESEADWSHPDLERRWKAAKQARLVTAPVIENEGPQETSFEGLIGAMCGEARRMAEKSGVIGVIANRVVTARAIHKRLSVEGRHAILMTGRSRPFDRAGIWETYRDRIRLGRDPECRPEEPIFVVATQCIEVGANVDFDVLVTEIAPLDALEQRFGRLNRDGRPIEAQAAIVAQTNQTAVKYDDAVYGPSIAETWRWLKEHAAVEKGGKKSKKKELLLDMGVAALRAAAPTGSERARLCIESSHAPVLLPAHIDRLSETAPIPAVDPDPALFLHGPQAGPADVLVVWRADLEDADQKTWVDIVSRVPPRAEEAVAIPIWTVRKWLARDTEASMELTDLEGANEPSRQAQEQMRPVVLWRGAESKRTTNLRELRPGMTIVVPCSYGGCDRWGWDAAYEGMVADVADFVSLDRRKPSLRLHPAVVAGWWTDVAPTESADLIERLRGCETIAEIRDALSVLAERTDIDDRVRRAARGLKGLRRLEIFRGEPDADGFSPVEAIASLQELQQESVTASYRGEVWLCAHLDDCRSQADRYAGQLKLPAVLANTVRRAAALHDIGKADDRFQAMLRRGVPRAPSEAMLAKSGMNGTDRAAIRRARQAAGYPEGVRHELQSLAMMESRLTDDGEQLDRELLLHLIASHHGRCRPFAPVVEDAEPIEVGYDGHSARSDHRYGAAGSGVSKRFWSLTRRYGWWGLAYLETLVRLADHRASEAEDQREEGAHAAASN